MKIPLAFAVVAPLAFSSAEQATLPEAFPPSRYEKLLEESPFAVATAAAPVAKPEDPWAANLSLGLAVKKMIDGQEKDWAVIKMRSDPTGDFTLTGSEPGPENIQLVKIEWSDDPAKIKAVVRKGDKEATLERNQADFAPPPPPPTPNKPGAIQIGNAPVPGGGNPLVGGVRKLPAQGAQVIPRPTMGVPPPANPGAPAGAPQPGNSRQRIRVIESGPRGR